MSAPIQVKKYVSNIAEIFAAYDRIKVFRATTENGTYAEVTDADTRPKLMADSDLYLFEDTTGTEASWYKTQFFQTADSSASSLSTAFQAHPPGYVTLDEVRAEGVPETVEDEQVAVLIDLWSRTFDDETGQWFEPRRMEVLIDGDGTRMIALPVPIIGLEALYLNDDFTNVAPRTSYSVYNKRSLPDDRQNPRIQLRGAQSRSVFNPPSVRAFADRFMDGYQNQKLVGLFGYVERDGATPPLVKRAILKLIKQSAKPSATYTGSSNPTGGQVVRVQVDRNSRTFQSYVAPSTRTGALALVKDPEIDAIINRYRAPRDVAVTGSDFVRG